MLCCILDLLTYLSAVFATYRANVRIIDPVKKAALSRMLLEGVVSTQPGEKLDEKLANLSLPTDTEERKSIHYLFLARLYNCDMFSSSAELRREGVVGLSRRVIEKYQITVRILKLYLL